MNSRVEELVQELLEALKLEVSDLRTISTAELVGELARRFVISPIVEETQEFPIDETQGLLVDTSGVISL